jgi:hypothetical protein
MKNLQILLFVIISSFSISAAATDVIEYGYNGKIEVLSDPVLKNSIDQEENYGRNHETIINDGDPMDADAIKTEQENYSIDNR